MFQLNFNGHIRLGMFPLPLSLCRTSCFALGNNQHYHDDHRSVSLSLPLQHISQCLFMKAAKLNAHKHTRTQRICVYQQRKGLRTKNHIQCDVTQSTGNSTKLYSRKSWLAEIKTWNAIKIGLESWAADALVWSFRSFLFVHFHHQLQFSMISVAAKMNFSGLTIDAGAQRACN